MHKKLVNKLTDFIQFEREIRTASSINALGFTSCNYLRKLVDYEVSLLLIEDGGKHKVNSVSGVSDFDARSPLVSACEELCNHREVPLTNVRVHGGDTLPENLVQRFNDIRIQQIATVGLNEGSAIFALIRDTPWQKHELQLLQQVGEVLAHAINALCAKQKKPFLSKLSPGFRPNWRWAVCALALFSIVPVPQSIIADAEVTARTPDVVAAGLNGVIDQILVRPNERVSKNQILLRFDDTDLTHRRTTLKQELALAQEQLRKSRQHSLNSVDEGREFAELESQLELKQLELDHINETMARLELRANTDGVVLFSRKQDWLGRSVATGEKIMEIAAADDNQFEIWVAANDAIELSKGRRVKFFPDAQPLEAVGGSVDSVGFFASNTDSETFAYRVVAEPTDKQGTLRLGMKGTARLYGDKVSIAYQIFRKPISALRKNTGV